LLSVCTMSAHLSPAKAAQVAGVSRWTVVRAINAQVLWATRDNRNQWRIKPEDLEAWRSAHHAQGAPTVHILQEQELAPQGAHAAAHPDSDLSEEVASLRTTLAVRDERLENLTSQLREATETIADLRKSRDEAQALALALAQRPAQERPMEAPSLASAVMKPSQPSRGFLARLLGR